MVKRAVLKTSQEKLQKGQNVAIKQYDKAKICQNSVFINNLRQEITTMSKLDHVGIMQFYDAIDSGNKVLEVHCTIFGSYG